MVAVKSMKAFQKKAQLLNELIFAVRVRRGSVSVTVENAPPQDGAFFSVIAKLIKVWVSHTWRWT